MLLYAGFGPFQSRAYDLYILFLSPGSAYRVVYDFALAVVPAAFCLHGWPPLSE